VKASGYLSVRRDLSESTYSFEIGEWMSGFAASSAMERHCSRKDGSTLAMLEGTGKERSVTVSNEDRSN